MTKKAMGEAEALKIIDNLIQSPSITPDDGMIVKFSKESAYKLTKALKEFDIFKAKSLTNGAKKVYR